MIRNLVLWYSILGMIFCASNTFAKEIHLEAGETFYDGDLTVTCGQPSQEEKPVSLNECQYWDDFKKKCLYEKTTYVYKNLECVEECQQWDSFRGICYFRKQCSFLPRQKFFVQTSCDKFDNFRSHCIKTKDTQIRR